MSSRIYWSGYRTRCGNGGIGNGGSDMGQLILTRRVGEVITIGEDILVTMLSINGNQIRVGIDAPKDIPVHRLEIKRRIDKEKEDGRLK